MRKRDTTSVPRVRRVLAHHTHSPAQLDKAARITPEDIVHAERTLHRDGPRSLVDKLDCDEYEGDGVPSDATRDP